MPENTRKPGDTARTLGVTGMTLRNYQKKFAPVLSEYATADTARRYTPEDIATLKHATEILRQGYTYEQTLEQLKEIETEPPLTGEVIDDIPPEPETQTDTSQEETTADEPFSGIELLDWFEETLKRQDELHQTALAAQNSHIEELKTDKERLQKQLNYERQPWFKKWFSETPE